MKAKYTIKCLDFDGSVMSIEGFDNEDSYANHYADCCGLEMRLVRETPNHATFKRVQTFVYDYDD